MTLRRRYWGNSKLAEFIRKVPKPKYATMEEWRDWKNESRNKHPIRFYIAEELLNDIQDVVNYIPDKIHNIKVYLKNRYIDKTHSLNSNLPRGKWHEFDDRLLHCVFDQFVDFIEIEKAHMLLWCKEEKYKTLKKDIFGRCPEAGIKYLEWESSLIDEFKNSPTFGKPSRQALSAQWQLKAYNWWKFERPNRPDPNDISGYNEYYDKKYPNGVRDVEDYFISDDEIKEIIRKTSEVEQQYYDEDSKYLIELIEHRNELWT